MINVNFENNDGSLFNLFEYQGNAWLIILFFRGAWCNHCKKQLREIERHIATFTELGVKIVAISSDSKFNSSILKTFLSLNFPVISDAKFTLIEELGLKTKYEDKEVAKPAIYLLKPDQSIAYNYIGQEYDDRLSATDIIQQIKQLKNETSFV